VAVGNGSEKVEKWEWPGTGDAACHYSLGQVLFVAGFVAAQLSRSYLAQCLLLLACFRALELAGW